MLTRSGKTTYGRIEGFDNLKNPPASQLMSFTVPNYMEGRPDIISNMFYQTVQLEWVIVLANHPKNPLNWPKTGDTIVIPRKSYVDEQL